MLMKITADVSPLVEAVRSRDRRDGVRSIHVQLNNNMTIHGFENETTTYAPDIGFGCLWHSN